MHGKLSADQAASRLGVKASTVYAYVSRGLLHPTRGPDGRSLFDRAEVERIAARGRVSRRGSAAGIVVESALTHVDGHGRLYYRGLDATVAARTHTFEQTAEWLWTGNLGSRAPWATDADCLEAAKLAQSSLGDTASIVPRLPLIVAAAAAADARRHDLGSVSIVRTARNILACVADALPARSGIALRSTAFAARLWRALSPLPLTDERLVLLDMSLSLNADHGVISSTLVGRMVAASGGDPYSVVLSALGPATASVRTTPFEEIRAVLEARREDPIARPLHVDRLRSSSSERYPKGDPRGRMILDHLPRAFPDVAEIVADVGTRVRDRGVEPDASFALAAVAFAANMPHDAAAAIALISRMAGWIAHALEEYRKPSSFRARESYVGLPPNDRRTLQAVQSYLARG